jgi:hypothetical protein
MTVDLNAAKTFLHANARVLERRRFACLFEGASPEPVVHALRAYRNEDGGFGHGLEPDMRAPTSQPVGIHTALEILHEVGARDEALIEAAGDWLTTITRPDGGIPFVLEDAMAYPHAPWWQYSDESSPIQTPINATALYALGSRHPWLEQAGEYCFRQIDQLDLSEITTKPGYALQFGVGFLNATPDEDRANRALDALAPALEPLKAAEPDPSAEVANPLHLAPTPDSRSRRLFDDALIERHLDAVEAAQQPDGSWTVSWPDWNPTAAIEWRGVATVHALNLLRANGRL